MTIFSKLKDTKFIDYLDRKSKLKRYLSFVLGVFFVAIAYNVFISPNKMVPGGVSGIAIVLNNLFGLDNSLVILIINIFLVITSFILLGKEKTKATILGSLLFPVFVKLTEYSNVWLQIDISQKLLAAIFGGMLHGFGLGLVFKAGFTIGGTDIVNQIISKYAKTSMGKAMLISDGSIILASGFFFGINSMLYSIIILYIMSLMSDKVVLGISDNKVFYIITDRDEEIKTYIMDYLKHGVTIFDVKSGYKNKNDNVLMTVLPTKDYYRLREGIKEIDKNAFFIVTDSYEVFGGE